MTPWFWTTYQMPAREVEQLTLAQADVYIADWTRRQTSPSDPASRS